MTASVMLAHLELPEAATEADIEEAHAELIAWLELAPDALKDWAADELAAADQAYADLLAPPPPAEPAPVAIHPITVRSRSAELDELSDSGDFLAGPLAEPRPEPRQTKAPRQPRTRARAARQSRADVPANTSRFALTPGLRKIGLLVGLVGLLAVVGFVGFKLGAPDVPGLTGTPAPSAAQNAVDPAQIGALMQKLAANPSDTETLQALADAYYAAGDYETASLWLDKLITVDPGNIAALLGSGAAAYNVGDLVKAEQQWRAVLAIEPDNVEGHYDLGFMYFTQDPPLADKARAEWNAVIALVPDSDVAKSIAAHLASLDAQASATPASVAGSPAPSSGGN